MDHLKQAAAIILTAATVSACSAVSVSADSFSKGDFNMDGSLNSLDALLILHASMKSMNLSDNQFDLADYNGNGVIESQDALLTLRASVLTSAKGTSEPAEKPLLQQTTVQPDAAPAATTTAKKTQMSEMKGWSAAEVVRTVGPLFTEDQRKTGVLASVSMAQFILESGYGQSDIAQKANNCFGIKGYRESTPRTNSPWDGVSVYTVSTKEYDYYGNVYYTTADFRKYASMEDSIEDHSLVLLNSSYDGGITHLYEGISGCTDYRKACQIIYNGGYCTDPGYVDYLCRLIEDWDLTQYDLANAPAAPVSADPVVTAVKPSTTKLYRVRLSWDDAYSQLGAYQYLENAKECADMNPGYHVYDEDGSVVY